MSDFISDLPTIGVQAITQSFQGNCEIEAPVRVDGIAVNTKIGAFTYAQKNTLFVDATVGRFCSIAEGVTLGPGEHPTDWLSTHPFVCDPNDVAASLSQCFPQYRDWLGSKSSRGDEHWRGGVEIGNDVWLGQNAFVRRGVKIGHGAIVGGGAVVTRDVAPYSVAAGNPARHIRFRIAESAIEKVLASRWWDYDLRPLTHKIDYSDLNAAVDQIVSAAEANIIQPLLVKRYEVTAHGARFIGQSAG